MPVKINTCIFLLFLDDLEDTIQSTLMYTTAVRATIENIRRAVFRYQKDEVEIHAVQTQVEMLQRMCPIETTIKGIRAHELITEMVDFVGPVETVDLQAKRLMLAYVK